MRFTILLLLAISFAACNNADKPGKSTVQSESGDDDIRNDIKVRGSGLTVEQAFLVFADTKKLVPAGNKVEIGQKVNMHLIIKGWEPVDGRVYLGASEKIATNDGQVVLDEKDLFGNSDSGVAAADAGAITLSAVITSIDKLYKYFEVSFKVWDKKSNDNVTGSYRLYLK